MSFFPGILDESVAVYLEDPAACPDATDKALLPNGSNGRFLRAGICMTSTEVIHLRSSLGAIQPPASFTFWSTSGGVSTYYKLTPRG